MKEVMALVSLWGRVPRKSSSFELVAVATPNSLGDATIRSLKSQWSGTVFVRFKRVSQKKKIRWLPILGVGLTLFVMLAAMVSSVGLMHGLMLGLFALVLVVYSLVCSVGLTSLFGIPGNPITAQVALILCLAIAVDITFVLAGLSVERSTQRLSPDAIASSLTLAGPSLFLAMLVLALTFCCTLYSRTPAGLGVVTTIVLSTMINFALQMCCMPSLMVLMSGRKPGAETAKRSKNCDFGPTYARFIRWVLARARVKAVIVITFVTVATASGVLVFHGLKAGIDSSILAPEGSNEAVRKERPFFLSLFALFVCIGFACFRLFFL